MASILKVDQLQKPDGSTPTAADLGIDVTSGDMPAGSVIQLQSSSFGSRVSGSSGSWYDIGLSTTITPTSASSKVYIQLNTNVCENYTNPSMGFRVIRSINGGSWELVGVGDTQFSGQVPTMMNWSKHSMEQTTPADVYPVSGAYLDSPSTTSSTVYKVQIFSYAGSWYVNGNNRNNNTTFDKSQISTLTLTEIAQ